MMQTCASRHVSSRPVGPTPSARARSLRANSWPWSKPSPPKKDVNWADIREEKNLKISDAEKAAILKEFPECQHDGVAYVDAVFEGGGVRGVALVGALRALHDAGIAVRKAAGTSAGSITAGAVAAGLSIEEIEEKVGKKDFSDFLQEKTSKWIFNGDPSDDLEMVPEMLINLSATKQLGEYKTTSARKWMGELTRDKSFGEVVTLDSPNWWQQRDLRIVCSDMTSSRMRLLPTDLPLFGYDTDSYKCADAMLLSMSIPFFFEPGQLTKQDTGMKHCIVDGGILSNFPIWIYDAPEDEVPKVPSIGLLLSGFPGGGEVKTAKEMLGAVLAATTQAHDKRYLRLHDEHRVIQLKTDKVSPVDFDLDTETKVWLYSQGYNCTKDFLKAWKWQAYVDAHTHRKEARKALVARMNASGGTSVEAVDGTVLVPASS